MTKLLVTLAAALMIAGCSTVKTSTKVFKPGEEIEPYVGAVCFIRGDMPEGIEYQSIGLIKGSKRAYGSVIPVLNEMAVEARKIGANAIIGYRNKQHVNVFSPVVARPIANGTAVKVTSEGFNCEKAGGEFH